MKANALPLFDQLLSCVQVEEIPGTDDIEEGKQAILATLNPGKYESPFRLTDPIYEPPDFNAEYEKSAPLAAQYKAAINKRQGIVEAYLSVYDNPETGKPFTDPYLDIIERGAFSKSIATHEARRKRTNNPHLMLYLWQHEKSEPLGGITHLKEDSQGVVYTAQVIPSARRGRQALDMLEQRLMGSSFGYDAEGFFYKGDIRHLTEIKLHEISVVSFPANPFAEVLDVKSRYYVPSQYPDWKPAAQPVDWQAVKNDIKKSDDLFDQLIRQGVNAYQQYKYEHR